MFWPLRAENSAATALAADGAGRLHKFSYADQRQQENNRQCFADMPETQEAQLWWNDCLPAAMMILPAFTAPHFLMFDFCTAFVF